MEIRKSTGLALALGLALVWGGWGEASPGERLAMTVEFAKAFPGLGGVERKSEFFIDQENRLVRIRDVTKGEYGGDPDIVNETVFIWDSKGVSWSDPPGTNLNENTIEFSPQGLCYRSGKGLSSGASPTQERKIRVQKSSEGLSWDDGRYSYSWSRGDGYQAIYSPESKGVPGWGFGYTTQGSRIIQWTEKGFENNRILVNRTPQSLKGLFVVESESSTGWEPIGTLQVSGPGLWSSNLLFMYTNAILLDLRDDLAFCAPLVFEKNYLK